MSMLYAVVQVMMSDRIESTGAGTQQEVWLKKVKHVKMPSLRSESTYIFIYIGQTMLFLEINTNKLWSINVTNSL